MKLTEEFHKRNISAIIFIGSYQPALKIIVESINWIEQLIINVSYFLFSLCGK